MTFYDDKDGSKNSILIKSKGGAKIFIDDDKKTVQIFDQSGKNNVIIDSQNNKISVKGEDKLDVNCTGDITYKCTKFKIDAGADVEIKSSANFKVTASSNVTIK